MVEQYDNRDDPENLFSGMFSGSFLTVHLPASVADPGGGGIADEAGWLTGAGSHPNNVNTTNDTIDELICDLIHVETRPQPIIFPNIR